MEHLQTPTSTIEETTEQKFLRLAVVEQVKFGDIESQHKIPYSTCSKLWKDLEEIRVPLSALASLWRKKFPNASVSFTDFKIWHDSVKSCHYCGITEAEIAELWNRYPELTKRPRGRKFEIDRVVANGNYTMKNIVCACYWCNNAKTDTFTEEEFKQIGQAIKVVWQKRLAE